jgi:hypothetical protein
LHHGLLPIKNTLIDFRVFFLPFEITSAANINNSTITKALKAKEIEKTMLDEFMFFTPTFSPNTVYLLSLNPPN